jgi:tRNA (adenine37-N6)-methyltransferase
LFHLNKYWKPLVTPPRFRKRKIGVFATRAPYRPNQIGLSCVKLEKAEGLKIFITESDILDGSPVLDIKPYLPFSDSFPGAKTGWVLTDPDNIYEVTFSEEAGIKAAEIKSSEGTNLTSYSKLQLEFTPADTSRKRISKYEISENLYTLSYRQWKLVFMVNEKDKKVLITDIIS